MYEYLIEYYQSHPWNSESQTFHFCSLPACSLFGASGDGHTWHVSMYTHTHTHKHSHTTPTWEIIQTEGMKD